MNRNLMRSAITVVAVIAVIFAILVITKYNGIIEHQVAVDKAWAPLLIKLRERYAPIPRFIVEVTAYVGKKPALAKQLESNREKVNTIKSISDAVDLANDIEIDLVKLLQWVEEKYPGIVSRNPVRAIVETLANTSNELGPEMTSFNDAVEGYNSYAQRFPNNVVAVILGRPTKYAFFQPRK